MNEETILELGNYCESLMCSNAFQFLCDTTAKQHYDAFLASEPHETKKREGIYSQVWGLQSFLGLMQTFVAQRDALIAKREEELARAEAALAGDTTIN